MSRRPEQSGENNSSRSNPFPDLERPARKTYANNPFPEANQLDIEANDAEARLRLLLLRAQAKKNTQKKQ